MSEKAGIITKLFDNYNGIITDYDGFEYNFSYIDTISDFDIKIGTIVIFRSEFYKINNTILKKAILIEKF